MDRLSDYRSKRDPGRTPEPVPDAAADGAAPDGAAPDGPGPAAGDEAKLATRGGVSTTSETTARTPAANIAAGTPSQEAMAPPSSAPSGADPATISRWTLLTRP